MMNLVALSLFVTSLVAAGVFSPTPQTDHLKHPSESESTIVKEGHRVVVVEYDEDGNQNTKISISPNDVSVPHKPKGLICDAYGKCKQMIEDAVRKTNDQVETAHEAAHEVGDTAGKVKEATNDASFLHGPKELICDAYGKCKQKITGAIGKAKGKIPETEIEKTACEGGDTAGKEKEARNDASSLHGPKELICDAYGKCEQKIEGAMGKTKDKASESTHEAAREVGNTAGKVKDTINDASFLHGPKELICDAYGKCKQKITGTMAKAKDKISETGTAAREAMFDKARDIHETARESAEKAKEVGKKMRGDNVARNVSREEAKEAVEDIASYIGKGSMEMLGSVTNVLNLLGFATAYGMCVWVTFISSSVLCGVIRRQQFGVVQSKIYTVYFKDMAYSIGLALLGHILSKHAQTFQTHNLLASFIATLINSIYLEPRATKTMMEKMKMEKEEGRGREDIAQRSRRTTEENHIANSDPKESKTGQDAVRSRIIRLNDKLQRLNSYSSFLNVLSLMSLTWHLVYLA